MNAYVIVLCSPFRETSNIEDGSKFCAGEFIDLTTFTLYVGTGSSQRKINISPDCFPLDMAIQNVIGDSFRGATWVAIHNGGGVGW